MNLARVAAEYLFEERLKQRCARNRLEREVCTKGVKARECLGNLERLVLFWRFKAPDARIELSPERDGSFGWFRAFRERWEMEPFFWGQEPSLGKFRGCAGLIPRVAPIVPNVGQ